LAPNRVWMINGAAIAPVGESGWEKRVLGKELSP
jgi:hypothetical protein